MEAGIEKMARSVRLRATLASSWLHPRHIGLVYIRRVLKRASHFASGRLLDIGCGLRPYESIFADRVTVYVGLDWPVPPGKARADASADALHIPFASAVFDDVLATELIEHLPNPDRFLAELARVLREGGILILSAPFMEPLHAEPRDYYRFTPHSLRLMLEEHGFCVEHIWPRGGWWSVVLGSFVSQSLYSLVNPINEDGKRRYNVIATAFVLPLCAFFQLVGYALDRIFKTPGYTLGYVVLATLSK